MTRRHSNSYNELEDMLDTEFQPDETINTTLLLNEHGGQSFAEVARELADLIQGAETFGVLVTTIHDPASNVAFAAVRGEAQRVADVAAFMAV